MSRRVMLYYKGRNLYALNSSIRLINNAYYIKCTTNR